MANLKIVIYPHEALRLVAPALATIDQDIRALTDEMVLIMKAAEGIGLAATQLGLTHRLIVIKVGQDSDGLPLQLANPVIVQASTELAVHDEGCLSIPGVTAPVKRPAQIIVTATTMASEAITIKAEGLLAVCLQHEIDHLNGKLFIDHLSRLRRNRVLSLYRKLRVQPEPNETSKL